MENKYDIQKTTTELLFPDLGNAHTECDCVKLVLRCQPSPGLGQ